MLDNITQQYKSGLFDFTERILDRTQDFTGRGWFFDTIDQWLGDSNGNSVFLSGGLGTGKSAIAIQLVRMLNQGIDKLLLAAQPDDPELLKSLMALTESQIFE